MTDAEVSVRALLDAAGIRCSEDEFDVLVTHFVVMREKLDAMYAPAYTDADPLLMSVSDAESKLQP